MFLTEIDEVNRNDTVSRLGVRLKSTSLYPSGRSRPFTGDTTLKHIDYAYKKRSTQSASVRREHYINDIVVPIRSSSTDHRFQRSYSAGNSIARIGRSYTSLSQKIPEWRDNAQVQRFLKKREHTKIETPIQTHRVDLQYYMAGRRVWLKDKYQSAGIREIANIPTMRPVLETSSVDTLNALAKAKMESLEYRKSLTILRDGTRHKNDSHRENTPAQRPPTSLSTNDTLSKGRDLQSAGKRSTTSIYEKSSISKETSESVKE